MRPHALIFTASQALLCAALAAPAAADTVTLTADKDNTMYAESTSESNGAGDFMFAGVNGLGQIRRALVHFNVAGGIPAGSTIVSATLQLYMSQTNAGMLDVSLHRALEDWGEGTSNAPSGEGSGATATANDATWGRRFFPGTLWTTIGGTFSPTASSTTSVDQNATYFWPTTTAMRADVQAWLDDPTNQNFGWVIVASDESSVPTAKRFTTRNNPSTSQRPKLTIVYSPPGCGTAANYCTAAPNSTGLGALISHTGSRSITANTFTLTCTQLPPNTTGLFFYGPNQIMAPFGNGFRCVGGSITRLNPPIVASPTGTIARAVDFTAPPANAITAGVTQNFQFWYRNPAGGGAGFNLSDGLAVSFCD